MGKNREKGSYSEKSLVFWERDNCVLEKIAKRGTWTS